MTERIKIAILDDYQNVATGLADWGSLSAEVRVFTKPFADASHAMLVLTLYLLVFLVGSALLTRARDVTN